MNPLIRFIVAGALVMVLAISLTMPVYAQDNSKDWIKTILGNKPLIPDACTEEPSANVNSCGLDAALQVIVNFSRLIVALAGSAALLIFIYGGTMWIIAAGSAEKIEKGKTAMASAVIGLIIILGAWTIVNFTILAITEGRVGGDATIFGKPWSTPPSSSGGTSGASGTKRQPPAPVGAPGDLGF